MQFCPQSLCLKKHLTKVSDREHCRVKRTFMLVKIPNRLPAASLWSTARLFILQQQDKLRMKMWDRYQCRTAEKLFFSQHLISVFALLCEYENKLKIYLVRFANDKLFPAKTCIFFSFCQSKILCKLTSYFTWELLHTRCSNHCKTCANPFVLNLIGMKYILIMTAFSLFYFYCSSSVWALISRE